MYINHYLTLAMWTTTHQSENPKTKRSWEGVSQNINKEALT